MIYPVPDPALPFLGVHLTRHIGGRMTDRFGGGRVIPFGLLFLAAGTVPFALAGANTSYWLLALGLAEIDELARATALGK